MKWLPVLLLAALPLDAANVLFDASHREMAGNADWIVDADLHNLALPAFGTCPGTTMESNPQRYPTPPQAGITAGTLETYWNGGASAMAVELAKAGHTIEVLPNGGQITYGNGGNPQDLSNYKVFIIPEPQTPFTASEQAAILAFVNAGGGLFMIADHETSDRDCDGFDSPAIFNQLSGATSTNGGVFGIWFKVDGAQNQGSEDWFNEGVNNNVTPDPADPIIRGPFGAGTGGLGLFGSTSMDLFPAQNATVKGHVWRNTQTARDNNRVTFATAVYGAGRVAAIGDSSPLDDGTGDSGDTLHPGWDKAVGGVNNREIHLNAVHWLTNPTPDTTAPVILTGPTATPGDCSALISWTTDENASGTVNYGPTVAYGGTANQSGYSQVHAVQLAGLSPAQLYHYRVSSSDAAGNGPTSSADATFTTAAATAPTLLTGPTATVNGTTVTLTWTTSEPSDSRVEYGTTVLYGSSAFNAAQVTVHSLTLTGLSADTLHHFRVGSTDGCGNGPTWSGDGTFTTGASALDIGGWVVEQFNSTQTYTFPAGTTIPSGGYLILGRDATRAQFEAFWGVLPPGTVYVNSNETGSCGAAGCMPQANGGESYRLKDAGGTVMDGTTITFTAADRTNQRTAPGDPANSAASWTSGPATGGTPGSGAGVSSGAGVRINEMTDASTFAMEFLELYYDVGTADTIPPAPITLAATPTGATTIRLDFLAPGDDGSTGTAAAYDARRAGNPINSEAAFSAATTITAPAPLPANTPTQITVSGLTANTTYCFAIKARDEANNYGARSNSPCATTGLAGSGGGGANHVVISQVRVAGTSDDFVELYNPTNAAVNFGSNATIQYLAANGNFGSKVTLTGTIPARGWYLVGGSGYAGPVAADQTSASIAFSNASGHVVLAAGTANTTCAAIPNIDKVGYGAATCPESAVIAAPGAGNSIVRKPNDTSGNGTDTDNNSADFQLLTPAAPRNSATPPASSGPALGNVGNSLYLGKPAATIRLDWASAFGANNYPVYRALTPTAMGAAWQTLPLTTHTDTENSTTSYFYRVLATDGTNLSAD